jgi:hypothetical protein
MAEITCDMVAKRHSDISKVHGKATARELLAPEK